MNLVALESFSLLNLFFSACLTLSLFHTFYPYLSTPSQRRNLMEAVWKTDVASSSHPIEKKTPTSLSWDQLGGCPDIPRLLALDVHSSYYKSLMSLEARKGARLGG